MRLRKAERERHRYCARQQTERMGSIEGIDSPRLVWLVAKVVLC